MFADDLTTGKSPIISSCESGVQLAEASGEYSAIVIQDAKQFVTRCKSEFATQTDGNSRLKIFLNIFVTLSPECRLMFKKIKIVGATSECIVADVVSIGNMASLRKKNIQIIQ